MQIKSIRHKFILAFLLVSLIPFIAFIIYSIEEGKKAVLKNTYEDLQNHSKLLVDIINSDLKNIQQNITLWASFQILDDILTEDIDKRIQSLIENILKTSGIKGVIVVSDTTGKVVASTDKRFLNKKINKNYIKNEFTDLHLNKTLNKYTIVFSKPVFSSFDRQNKIGYIVLIYFMDNFIKYLINDEKEFSVILNKDKVYFVGQSIDIFEEELKDEGFLTIPGYIVVYKRIKNNIFKDRWYLAAAIDEEYVFKPIEELRESFIVIGIAGIFLIVLTSIVLSEKIVKPIRQLSKVAKEITQSRDYSKTFVVNTKDEIQVLAQSFNEMITEINKAFTQIERESLERLKLFLKLTETFNEITKAKEPKQVFDIVSKQLKDFPHIKEIGFSAKPIEGALNVKLETDLVKGYLFFRTDQKLTKEEEKFFKSIGTFVNLWIERIELLEKATQSSKAKSAFIANMSHELRTPLNSIIGFAQFFQMAEDIPEEYRELAKNIETSGQHLLELINDILDFSKAEAGKVKVNKINANINSIVEECVSIIKPLADEKGLRITVKMKESIMFETDVKLFRQILLNLLSNAVKFTEEGEISINVKLICKKLFVRVKDTGIGIAKEDLDKLFSDFTQLENPMQKKYKGTGLGLSITKRYVELLGGKIKVYSEGKGKGARFIFYVS